MKCAEITNMEYSYRHSFWLFEVAGTKKREHCLDNALAVFVLLCLAW